jgi:hypothetical protein
VGDEIPDTVTVMWSVEIDLHDEVKRNLEMTKDLQGTDDDFALGLALSILEGKYLGGRIDPLHEYEVSSVIKWGDDDD